MEAGHGQRRVYRAGDGGSIELENSFFINPGLRYAIDFESGLQIAPGPSFPVGLGPSEGAFGAFLYVSFEHPFSSHGH